MDGSLRKPTKSTLLKELEMDSLAKSTLPAYSVQQTAYIVDLLAIIQMLSKGNMKTFGELSGTIAGTIIAKFQFANQVHIVPDRYDVKDLIKSGEISRRVDGHRNKDSEQRNEVTGQTQALFVQWKKQI